MLDEVELWVELWVELHVIPPIFHPQFRHTQPTDYQSNNSQKVEGWNYKREKNIFPKTGAKKS